MLKIKRLIIKNPTLKILIFNILLRAQNHKCYIYVSKVFLIWVPFWNVGRFKKISINVTNCRNFTIPEDNFKKNQKFFKEFLFIIFIFKVFQKTSDIFSHTFLIMNSSETSANNRFPRSTEMLLKWKSPIISVLIFLIVKK